LQHIVGKLLEKDVVRRYADANELLADLTREIATSAPRGRLVGSLPRSPGGIIGVAAAALAVAIGGATLGVRTYGRLSTSSASPPVEVKSIAVLPFSSLAPSDDEEYLTDGLAEGLTGVLSSVQALSVVGRTSAFNFKHGRQDVQQVGRVLHVGSVVTGTVERLGDRLRVHARLYNTADSRQLWADSSERSIANVVALQHDLALHIATALGAKLSSSERERLSRRATANAEAYALYLRGRYFWNQRTSSAYARAMEYFHRAIEIDSTYAPAYAGIAAVYSQQGMAGQLSLERAQARSHAAALRAVALDSTLAEGHAVLGVYLHSYEWDSGAAERELKRAIELDPNFALAHHYYGNVLRSLGRLDEAIVQNRKAVELEPLVPGFSETLAFTLMRAGRPAEALEQIRAALELDSTYWRAHAVLGIVYEGMHRDADAIRAYERANQLAGPAAHRSTAALARVLARIGRDRDARRLVDTLRSMAKRTGTYEADVASALYALGDVSECFAWLERAYRQRNPDLRYIDGDPRFVPLNHEPRFVDLMRRVGVRH
jgi:TolB-like protein/lipopolysaccharide biosynthesis regulator YciM